LGRGELSADASGTRLRLRPDADATAALDAVRAHVAVRDFGVEAPSLLECGVRVDFADWCAAVGPEGMSEDGKAVNTFQVSVGHVDQLKNVLRNLQSIEGVVSAERR